jgi:hypothetical protein
MNGGLDKYGIDPVTYMSELKEHDFMQVGDMELLSSSSTVPPPLPVP